MPRMWYSMQRVPQLPLAPGYPGTLYCVLIARTQGPGQNESLVCVCVYVPASILSPCQKRPKWCQMRPMYRLVFSLPPPSHEVLSLSHTNWLDVHAVGRLHVMHNAQRIGCIDISILNIYIDIDTDRYRIPVCTG